VLLSLYMNMFVQMSYVMRKEELKRFGSQLPNQTIKKSAHAKDI